MGLRSFRRLIRQSAGHTVNGRELWVPTIAKMVESSLFASRDSRPDETSAQSTVIWNEDIDWSA